MSLLVLIWNKSFFIWYKNALLRLKIVIFQPNKLRNYLYITCISPAEAFSVAWTTERWKIPATQKHKYVFHHCWASFCFHRVSKDPKTRHYLCLIFLFQRGQIAKWATDSWQGIQWVAQGHINKADTCRNLPACMWELLGAPLDCQVLQEIHNKPKKRLFLDIWGSSRCSPEGLHPSINIWDSDSNSDP